MSRSLARQSDTIAAQQAYRRVSAICAAIELHITAQGEAGLHDALRQYAGDNDTVKASILGIVRRRLPGALVMAREALCV
jgi:hypothetical protein